MYSQQGFTCEVAILWKWFGQAIVQEATWRELNLKFHQCWWSPLSSVQLIEPSTCAVCSPWGCWDKPLHPCFHPWYMALKAHSGGPAKPSFLYHSKHGSFILPPFISSVETSEEMPNVTWKMMLAKLMATGKRLKLKPACSSHLIFSMTHPMVPLNKRTSGHQVGWESGHLQNVQVFGCYFCNLLL